MTFEKTQSEMACVVILVSKILEMYAERDRLSAVNKNMINPVTTGKTIPEIMPAELLSSFGLRFIF
jgi:hypothetical protein